MRLLSSRQAITTMENGEQIRKLYDARLSLGDVTMVCDSAWQFLGKEELRAFGNIQIDTSTENIWADTLYYYTNRDQSLLRGRVVILQDSTTLFGQKVDYNFLTKEAFFREGIRLEDDDGVLTALTGTYFQNQDSAVFRQQVQIADSAQYAEGDSLFINRKREYLQMHSNVLVIDSTNNGLLTGDYLEADSTGYRYVRGNGYLRKIDTDSLNSDTTHIYGDELLMTDNDSTDTISGYGEVSTWSVNFSSLSDSLFYDADTELFELSGKPKAWHKNIQLSGPFISVQMDSSSVEELRSFPKAFAVQEDSVTGRLNQLKGDTLLAYFDAGDISRIEIYPNSKVLYHTKNDDGEADGAMESNSPKTILYFDDGQLTRAKMGQNSGFFLPEYEGLPERRLEGFVWTPKMRPQKPEKDVSPQWEPISIERPFILPDRYLNFIENRTDL